ncbi:MAG: heavy metal-associated domain-containing protein, partial [Pricia sp.]
MKHLYEVTGMTCNGCKASVTDTFSKVEGVTAVKVDLEKSEAEVTMEKHIPLETFSDALPSKYTISEKGDGVANAGTKNPDSRLNPSQLETDKNDAVSEPIEKGANSHQSPSQSETTDGDVENSVTDSKSKLQQLKPLLLIFIYLFAAAILLNYREWNTAEAMLDFMGLFYIVLSFFKLLDLKGFPESFRMYDPLAKVVPAYGWVYPFVELTLG